MSQIAVFITHRIKVGQREAVQAIWQRHMAPAVQANDGHEAYFYCLDPADPDVVCAFQMYRDASAAAAFLRTEAYLEYEQEVSPLLLGAPGVKQLVPVWSKVSSGSDA